MGRDLSILDAMQKKKKKKRVASQRGLASFFVASYPSILRSNIQPRRLNLVSSDP